MKWSDSDAYKYFNKEGFIYRIYLYLFEALCLKDKGQQLQF